LREIAKIIKKSENTIVQKAYSLFVDGIGWLGVRKVLVAELGETLLLL
jgi:hypothetical protein